MSVTTADDRAVTVLPAPGGVVLALAFVSLVLASGALAGGLPVWFSIVAVVVFAGPHNWMEARYILGRLPARTGKLHGYFVLSAVGVVGLSAAFALFPLLQAALPGFGGAAFFYAAWNTALLAWLAALIVMRSKTNPRFDGGWAWPAALLLIAGVWLHPVALNVALVYLHPLLALILLDRELARSHRSWRGAYRAATTAVPVVLAALWAGLHDAPDLPGVDPLSATIAAHAGADYLSGVSTHFLVSAHTFLEMVHYGAWVVLIPLVGLRSRPWELRGVPLARRGRSPARLVAGVLLAGLCVVLLLWLGFGVDFAATRTIYFTIAIAHVLAEAPFLLRML